MTVKKCDGDYVATLKIKNDDAKYFELPSKRLALFCERVDDINTNVKALMKGEKGINFRAHTLEAVTTSALPVAYPASTFANSTNPTMRVKGSSRPQSVGLHYVWKRGHTCAR